MKVDGENLPAKKKHHLYSTPAAKVWLDGIFLTAAIVSKISLDN